MSILFEILITYISSFFTFIFDATWQMIYILGGIAKAALGTVLPTDWFNYIFVTWDAISIFTDIVTYVFPVYEMFTIASNAFVICGLIILIRWCIAFIPTVGAG